MGKNTDDITATSSGLFPLHPESGDTWPWHTGLNCSPDFKTMTHSCLWIIRKLLTAWWSDAAPQVPACLCSAGPTPGGGAARRWGRPWLAGMGSAGSLLAEQRRGRATLHSRPHSSGPWNLKRLINRANLRIKWFFFLNDDNFPKIKHI